MELDIEQESQVPQRKTTASPTRRKHVVMVTDLDTETESEKSEEEENTSLEIPYEIRKTLKKIPKELLVPRTCAFLTLFFINLNILVLELKFSI